MKLMRVGPRGAERPAMLDGAGVVRDLSGIVEDIAGEVLSEEGLARLRSVDPGSLPEVPADTRVGPPVGRVQKFVCVGLNYEDHAREAGQAIPTEPILFGKAISALSGPDDAIEQPQGSTKLDYEIELAVVVGRTAKNVAEADAMAHVAGFAVFNDVSERAFQIERQGQWIKGKSHDGFGPLGPWLVTKDEIADVGRLDMTLDVNGERRQTGNTETLIFSVPHLVSYISQFMTLHPGDVIPTGTPPGVALGMAEPKWLMPGDELRLEIAGLGVQRQEVVASG
ncbi:MAG TPA: fumarylacetoacetate hydrolase family protein [Thermohalobaculum sp.]|nr:fumarylacetoacetate hydrolase family protein [Thermohalobaculum sp.]